MKKPTLPLPSFPTQRQEGEDAGIPGASEMSGSSEMALFLVIIGIDFHCAREQPEAISNLQAALTQVKWRKIFVTA